VNIHLPLQEAGDGELLQAIFLLNPKHHMTEKAKDGL